MSAFRPHVDAERGLHRRTRGQPRHRRTRAVAGEPGDQLVANGDFIGLVQDEIDGELRRIVEPLIIRQLPVRHAIGAAAAFASQTDRFRLIDRQREPGLR